MKRLPKNQRFNLHAFLNTGGLGKKVVQYRNKQVVFSQGEESSKVFYIQKGRVKLTVLSKNAKEAVVAILTDGDFLGEGCLAGQPLRMATATAISASSILEIRKSAMMRVLREEHAFSERFIAHILERNIRFEADLVDQLFNSSERRLARTLLLLAIWQGRQARDDRSQNQPGNPRRNGGNHSVACEFFHEQIQKARFHRVQRRALRAQLAPQRRPRRRIKPSSPASDKFCQSGQY